MVGNLIFSSTYYYHIGGVMVGVLETKDYKIDICCFSAKHAAL